MQRDPGVAVHRNPPRCVPKSPQVCTEIAPAEPYRAPCVCSPHFCTTNPRQLLVLPLPIPGSPWQDATPHGRIPIPESPSWGPPIHRPMAGSLSWGPHPKPPIPGSPFQDPSPHGRIPIPGPHFRTLSPFQDPPPHFRIHIPSSRPTSPFQDPPSHFRIALLTAGSLFQVLMPGFPFHHRLPIPGPPSPCPHPSIRTRGAPPGPSPVPTRGAALSPRGRGVSVVAAAEPSVLG